MLFEILVKSKNEIESRLHLLKYTLAFVSL